MNITRGKVAPTATEFCKQSTDTENGKEITGKHKRGYRNTVLLSSYRKGKYTLPISKQTKK